MGACCSEQQSEITNKETEKSSKESEPEPEPFKTTKPMNQWGDSEVKQWINSISSDVLNTKQKALICNGVDSAGFDGDSLASADGPKEIGDGLEIPIILARKVYEIAGEYLEQNK